MLRTAALSAALVRIPEELPTGASSGSGSRVDYALVASLEPKDHRIASHGTISITNSSSKALDELWFHLYMNAFQHTKTVFLRQDAGTPALSRSQNQLGRPGSIAVQKFATAEEPDQDLWAARSAHSPGDPDDETDIRVPLKRQILPGKTQVFLVEFETILPQIVERTGFEGTYHFMGQWYPKVARLEPSGAFRHFAFHAQAEFAANFGDYHMELSVPSDYRIGHSGRETQRIEQGGTLRVSTELMRAHDFAWTAWPEFVEQRATLSGIDVRLLHPEGMGLLAQDTWEVLESALTDFNERFGAYPYDTLTVVHPPEFAAASGGMEYPSLITTGGFPWLPLLGVQWNRAVTAHELAHQWFYGCLASDEYQEPFLDESLTTWAESTFLASHFGDSASFSSPWLSLSAWSALRYQAFWGNDSQSALLPAAQYRSFNALASSIYGRAPLALETIRRVRGSGSFDAAMQQYTAKYRFKYPNSADFLDALQAELGDTGRAELVQLLEGRSCGYRLQGVETREQGSGYSSSISVALEGSVILPTLLELHFGDGTTRQIPIEGILNYQFEHQSPLVSVQIDPQRNILLDPRLANNHWRSPAVAPNDEHLWTTLFARVLSEVALWSIF